MTAQCSNHVQLIATIDTISLLQGAICSISKKRGQKKKKISHTMAADGRMGIKKNHVMPISQISTYDNHKKKKIKTYKLLDDI